MIVCMYFISVYESLKAAFIIAVKSFSGRVFRRAACEGVVDQTRVA